jgi:hypothetical protein
MTGRCKEESKGQSEAPLYRDNCDNYLHKA